jgi:hypothetical protein
MSTISMLLGLISLGKNAFMEKWLALVIILIGFGLMGLFVTYCIKWSKAPIFAKPLFNK